MQENTDIYYLYFVLDGICYQIDCVGTLEASQDVVEHMALEDICPSASNVSLMGDKMKTNDLLYRKQGGETIYVERGERINLIVENFKEYNNVSIGMVGEEKLLKIGNLNPNHSYSFVSSCSGEYIVFAGKRRKNITGELSVEHGWEASHNAMLPIG